MSNIVLKKWIEPYVLLETLKKHYEMKDFTFDGWSKEDVKKDFFKALNMPGTMGLYMKNVNKFYLFSGVTSFNVTVLFNFESSDYEIDINAEKSIELVDMGRAEATFIHF